MNERNWLAVVTTALFALVSVPASADPSTLDPTIGYNYSEIEIPRHAATGGAQRALGTSIGGLFVNPANIAIGRVYHVGAFVQLWPEASRQSYGAAASDSLLSSSRLAGAAGVTQNFQDPDGVDREWTDVRFALAYPFSDQLFFGVGGRYMWLEQNGGGPLSSTEASSGLRDEDIVNTVSFDGGVTLKATPELSIAVVGNNLGNPGHGLLPTSVGGGIGFGRNQFAIEADVVADFTTWNETKLRAMAGLEMLLAQRIALRGGYRYDQGAESHALSFGVGYIERAFLIDVGARRVISGDTATALVLGFTYHLETTGLAPSPADTF
ncbi:MAG TPA: hypothetical protein VIM73_14875 [Polyangiaceae bacterium]